MKEDLICCHIIFKGRVQGVGFRFTTRHLANSYNLSGFVRNLFSGDVEVEVEGERPTIENFLEDLRKQMGYYIRDLKISWKEYRKKFKNFEIRF